MKRVRVYPYKMGSKGAGRLTEALRAAGVRALKVYPDRGFRPRRDDLIINWGNGVWPEWINRAFFNGNAHFNNSCDAVKQASNKLTAFEAMKETGISIPEFTTDVNVAQRWKDDGRGVFGRRLLRGTQGRGIETWGLVSEDNPVDGPRCPLYVKYIKKAAEYRVHVFNGEVVDVQQKRQRRGYEDTNHQIRNHENGWVFCREDIRLPDSIPALAIASCNALGLDFGAVDVIWNNHYQRAYTLEVNCAPGIEGRTVDIYVNAIRRML